MKKKIFSFLLLSLSIILSACGSNDNNTPDGCDISVTLSTEAIKTSAVGGTYTITVSTNATEWTAYATDTWIKAVPDTKTNTITVTVLKNDAGIARTADVKFKSKTTYATVKVTQSAPISSDVTSVFSKAIGETLKINISSDDVWTATTTESWITPVKNGSLLEITTLENKDVYRTGIVKVTTANESIEITVKQDANTDIVSPVAGYHLVWNDEFGTGSTLDPTRWVHEVQSQGWVNNELQNYVNGKTPLGARVTEVKDGYLNINCLKENGKVYSGRVYGNQAKGFTYGVFEARIKLPKGKGTWPAWWMMPVIYTGWPHCGEIDIMEEVGANPNYVSSSIHCTAYNHPNNTQKTHEMYCAGAEGEFHVYTLEWTTDYIKTWVDGKEQLVFMNDKTNNDDTWPFHVAFYPILNLAWGGTWGGYKGVDESVLPVTMQIDYVRIFQK